MNSGMKKKKKPLTADAIIRKRRKYYADKAIVFDFLKKLALFSAIIYVVFFEIFGVTVMNNADMMPRISAGDVLVYYRLDKAYKPSDVVLFRINEEALVGRVIAKPGDTIEITDDERIMINNGLFVENDIYFKTYKYDSDVVYPVVLSEDQYFILCDRRAGAKDSRYFGPVYKSQIIGKMITLLRRNHF